MAMSLTEAKSLDIVFGAISLLFILLLFRRTSVVPKGLPLPPGPPGKRIVGNAADMPTKYEWKTYTRWAQEYGDLVHVQVYGQSMVLVNSLDVARDLFERKSSIYSDRFQFPMLNDLMGFDWSFGLMPYGERWRRHRKMFHEYFRPSATVEYHKVQTTQIWNLLRRLQASPDDFIAHLRNHAGATIMQVVYGIKVLPKDDPYIEAAEKAMSAVAEAGNPGTFLVDALKFLKYVPEWMPGAGFQRKARAWRVSIKQMPLVPFMAVKKALTAGTAEFSVAASLLEDLSHKESAPADAEEVISNSMAAAYGAGTDTIVSALSGFILAMVLYPEAQQKAQVELDSVIGMGQLPTFEDRKNLPYINALCKEIHRWHVVVPLGIAHRIIEDDIYKGYFIPRGSIITGNAWAILQDEKTYGPEPEVFRPERFLNPDVKDPIAAFGFGRRICPGRHFANDSMFITVASILKVFDISRARNNHGKEIPVESSFTSGFITHPEPFKCAIKPRSKSAENLILERAED